MSELTPCNYCTLKFLRQQAAKRSVTIVLGKDEHGWVTATYSDQDEPTAWFMELTERCVC